MALEDQARTAPIDATLPPLGPGCFAEGALAAGQLFVQDVVRCGGRTGRFDDVVGRGFVLVSPAGDPGAAAGPALAGWFASIGGIFAHVAPDEDVNGGYARWFAQQGAEVALVRPDFAVFGAAKSLNDAGDLVRALRERLAGSSG